MVFIEKMNELRKEKVTLLMSCHEKYLIKSISDTVMAVGDGQVKQVDITTELYSKEYILWFEKQENASLPEQYRACIQPMGEGCRARIQENESSRMILEMIRHGWKLRGMSDAGV